MCDPMPLIVRPESMYHLGPLNSRGVLLHMHAPTHAQEYLESDKLHVQIKLLITCFYYLIACV